MDDEKWFIYWREKFEGNFLDKQLFLDGNATAGKLEYGSMVSVVESLVTVRRVLNVVSSRNLMLEC